MPANRRRGTTGYSAYGGTDYSSLYDGNAVRAPQEPRRAPAPVPQPKKQIRRHERTRAEVRQAGQIAPFAVIGFLAVAILAALLVTSYAQLTVVNDEMVSLRRELSNLKEENVTLSAQYEKIFDLDTIQEAVGDTMVRPTGEQLVYIDLSEPDTVTVYQEGGGIPGLQGLLDGMKDLFGNVIEYFR